MQRVNKTHLQALAIAFVGIWLVIAASLAAAWLTGEVRVIGFVMMPVAVVAGLLIVFYERRAGQHQEADARDRRGAGRDAGLSKAA